MIFVKLDSLKFPTLHQSVGVVQKQSEIIVFAASYIYMMKS